MHIGSLRRLSPNTNKGLNLYSVTSAYLDCDGNSGVRFRRDAAPPFVGAVALVAVSM